MYAIIENGGKQFRIELGSQLEVDRLAVEPGDRVEVDRVLLVADGDEASVGRPLVPGARVLLDVLRHDRGEKIVVFKYRPKARHRVKKGHRQDLTVLRVADIVVGDRSAARLAEAGRLERDRLAAEAAAAAEQRAAADRALAERLAREADSESGTDAGTDSTADAAPGRTSSPSRPRGRRSAQAAPSTPSAPKSASTRRPSSRTQAPEPGDAPEGGRRSGTPPKDA